MTVSTAPTPLTYNGDGSNTIFPITWKYNAKSHVVATLRDADGDETVWVLNTNYTLTDPGDSGTLTATVAPASGTTLVITLEPPNTQSSSLPLGGDFPSTSVEDGFDLAAQRDAKIEALFNRSLRVPKTDTESGSDLELPIDSERASNYLAFDADGKPIASSGPTGDSSIPVSDYVETLLDDVDADSFVQTLIASLTAETSLSSNDTIPIGDTSEAKGNKVTLSNFIQAIAASGTPINLTLSPSVGSSALTMAVKGANGNDPSSTNVVLVPFRSATASSGLFNWRTITGALSTVISSGSTGGHGSGLKQFLFWYLIDNAGTPELAWSGKFHGWHGIVSTTAEGGAGSADSGTTMYSTTARSSVSFICVGRTEDTQATAGTWATAPSSVQLSPFPFPDYEDGLSTSWTPAITFDTPGDLSVAYSEQDGTYIKIGRLVMATWRIATSAFTHTTASGELNLTGLPFASEVTQNPQGAVSWQGITKASYTHVTAHMVSGGSTTLKFNGHGSGQNISRIAAADMPTGGTVILRGSLVYISRQF